MKKILYSMILGIALVSCKNDQKTNRLSKMPTQRNIRKLLKPTALRSLTMWKNWLHLQRKSWRFRTIQTALGLEPKSRKNKPDGK